MCTAFHPCVCAFICMTHEFFLFSFFLSLFYLYYHILTCIWFNFRAFEHVWHHLSLQPLSTRFNIYHQYWSCCTSEGYSQELQYVLQGSFCKKCVFLAHKTTKVIQKKKKNKLSFTLFFLVLNNIIILGFIEFRFARRQNLFDVRRDLMECYMLEFICTLI